MPLFKRNIPQQTEALPDSNILQQEAEPSFENNAMQTKDLEYFIQMQLEELQEQFPESEIKSISDILNRPDGEEIMKYWGLGIPLAKAYAVCNLDEITGRRSDAAMQNAFNQWTNRSHLQPTRGGVANEVSVPPEVMEEYLALVPGASMSEIKRHYQRRH